MKVLLAPVCCGLLGLLLGGDVGRGAAGVVAGLLGGAAFGFLALPLMGAALTAGNKALRGQPDALAAAITDAAVTLVPFTVVAMVAEWGLHWNAAQAFASAAIMSASAAAGASAMRSGGSRIANLVGPSLLGMAASALWMGAAALLARGGGH